MKEFFKDISADFFSEIWTFVGFFAVWLVLEGKPRTITGQVILGAFVLWIITLRLRNPKE